MPSSSRSSRKPVRSAAGPVPLRQRRAIVCLSPSLGEPTGARCDRVGSFSGPDSAPTDPCGPPRHPRAHRCQGHPGPERKTPPPWGGGQVPEVNNGLHKRTQGEIFLTSSAESMRCPVPDYCQLRHKMKSPTISVGGVKTAGRALPRRRPPSAGRAGRVKTEYVLLHAVAQQVRAGDPESGHESLHFPWRISWTCSRDG